MSTPRTQAAWQVPTRTAALWLQLRASGLRLHRAFIDRVAALPRHRMGTGLAQAPVAARCEQALWAGGEDAEFALTAGKVQNLRVVRSRLHGLEVPAGQVWSFWRQVGPPHRRHGFVPGRELRAGCVVPAIAGGICQVTNALASCAHQAGFALVERHGHTAPVATSATGGIDATVFWNYLDLRIRAPVAWRIEIEMDATTLLVRLRSAGTPPRPAAPAAPPPLRLRAPLPEQPPRSCLACTEAACFRHAPDLAGGRARLGREAWLLDAWTPEFERYLGVRQGDIAGLRILAPPPLRRAGTRRWQDSALAVAGAGPHDWLLALRRAAGLRWQVHRGGHRQAAILDGQRRWAEHLATRLTSLDCRLVIDQALAPWLYRAGVLAGRDYEVLLHSLPVAEIQRRLDAAVQLWPQLHDLRDFRADPALAIAEEQALRGASRLVTAHALVAHHLRALTAAPVTRLDWAMPTVGPVTTTTSLRPTLVFGASALPRKGIAELAQAAHGLDCTLRVLGSVPPEVSRHHLQGLELSPVAAGQDWREGATLLVLPAHVEHAPRHALVALASGIPVIASQACGLSGLPGVSEVDAGDVAALRQALHTLLAARIG